MSDLWVVARVKLSGNPEGEVITDEVAAELIEYGIERGTAEFFVEDDEDE